MPGGQAFSALDSAFENKIDRNRTRFFQDQAYQQQLNRDVLHKRNSDQQFEVNRLNIDQAKATAGDMENARKVMDIARAFVANPEDVSPLNEAAGMVGSQDQFKYDPATSTYLRVKPNGQEQVFGDQMKVEGFLRWMAASPAQLSQFMGDKAKVAADAAAKEDDRAHEWEMSAIEQQRKDRSEREKEDYAQRNRFALEDYKAVSALDKTYQDAALDVWKADQKPVYPQNPSSDMQAVAALARHMPLIPGETEKQHWMRAYKRYMKDKNPNSMFGQDSGEDYYPGSPPWLSSEPTQSAPTDRAASGPTIGTIDSGYRFKGGNPADPNSWEPVK